MIVVMIKPNREIFDIQVSDINAQTDVVKQNILTKIQEYVTIETIEDEHMMEFIVNTLGMTKDLVGNTSTCYEDGKYVYQLCHLSMKDNGQEEDDNNINYIASCLTVGKIKVHGNAVLLKSKITENYTCASDDVTMDEVTDIVYSKFIHKGVVVSASGKVEEYLYLSDPLEHLSEEIKKKYKSIDLPFYKFNLLMYVEVDGGNTDDAHEGDDADNTDNTIKKVNKKATKLYGSEIIHGKVFIVSKSTEHEFLDITYRLLNDMLCLAEGPLKNRTLTEEDNKEEKINDLPIVNNKYCFMDKKLKDYKEKCNYCSKILGENSEYSVFVCGGCYRIKYHDKECQNSDWFLHKEECLYGKKSLQLKLGSKQ